MSPPKELTQQSFHVGCSVMVKEWNVVKDVMVRGSRARVEPLSRFKCVGAKVSPEGIDARSGDMSHTRCPNLRHTSNRDCWSEFVGVVVLFGGCENGSGVWVEEKPGKV